MCADVIDAENVGMIECSGSLCFLLEAIQSITVLRSEAGRTLIATLRPSFVSRARKTSPVPPAPIFERIVY
jgi:hypothetical protein